jgi:hypothetical protein
MALSKIGVMWATAIMQVNAIKIASIRRLGAVYLTFRLVFILFSPFVYIPKITTKNTIVNGEANCLFKHFIFLAE